MNQNSEKSFIGYEYKDITVPAGYTVQFIDCYRNFGWTETETNPVPGHTSHVTIRMNRDRKIIHKTELTRLERHFEACAMEIQRMEHSKATAATAGAMMLGCVGAVFAVDSVLSGLHEPPMMFACVTFGIIGVTAMALPCTVYRCIEKKRSAALEPIIEAKRDEIYDICKKGFALL